MDKIERRDVARAILKYRIGENEYEFTYPELRQDFGAKPHTAPARRLRNLLDSMEEEELISVGKKGRSRNRIYTVEDLDRIKKLAGMSARINGKLKQNPTPEVDEEQPLPIRLEERIERVENLLQQLLHIWS